MFIYIYNTVIYLPPGYYLSETNSITCVLFILISIIGPQKLSSIYVMYQCFGIQPQDQYQHNMWRNVNKKY